MGVGDNGGEKRVTWGTSSISPFTLLFVLVALAGSLCRVLSRPFSFPEELDLLDSLPSALPHDNGLQRGELLASPIRAATAREIRLPR